MKRLRIKKLLDKLNSINAEYPGIIKSQIQNDNYPGLIRKLKEDSVRKKINSLIESIRTLSNLSSDYVIQQLLTKYTDSIKSTSNLISTGAYGEIIGIDAKPYLFDNLISLGLIEKPSKSYQLTQEGHKFGAYLEAEDGVKFIGWNQELLDSLIDPLKKGITKSLNFRIFHITHISNLESILIDGLYSHNNAHKYLNISNMEVNARRNKAEKHHNHNIHDYVPLYFNPRNAMLYQKENEFKNEIVILEIDKSIINQNYTLFCKGNAARSDVDVTPSKIKVEKFPWNVINSKYWSHNGIIDGKKKSLMMSECLVYKHIPPLFIKHIHYKNSQFVSKLSKLSSSYNKDIQISPNLYF